MPGIRSQHSQSDYDCQKKDKHISGMGSWFWYSGKVHICIRHIAPLTSGQSGVSFTERVKGYISNDPF